MAKRRTRRTSGSSINPIALIVIAVLAVLAVVGICLWVKDCREDRAATATEAAITVTPTAAPEDETTAAGETKPAETTAAEGTEPEETTAASAETTQATKPAVEESVEGTLDQLVSVVGWALTDTDPDGFHYKYFSDKSVQSLAKAVLTLASKGNLGVTAVTDATDDPNQVMMPAEQLNSLLSSMVKDAALSDGQSSGTLKQIGDGWAMTPPADAVMLPHTAIVGDAEFDGVRELTVVLVQPTEDGETVLRTAQVEVEPCDTAYGWTVLSWVSRDVPRFTRKNEDDTVRLTSGVSQSVTAVEITWSADVEGAKLWAGSMEEELDGKAGETVVVVLDSEQQLTELTLTVADPAAVSAIKAY